MYHVFGFEYILIRRTLMVHSAVNIVLLVVSTLISIIMILEGILLLTSTKLITPIPSKILVMIGNGFLGREKSAHYFSGKNTLSTQRTYALFSLGFGVIILVACAFNLTLLLNS
jgi:hypothetical protein